METGTKFYIIFTPVFEDRAVYGPFKTHSDAKSRMAQEFNDAVKVAKMNNKNVHWNWNVKKLGSCKLEGVGSWEIVKNEDL